MNFLKGVLIRLLKWFTYIFGFIVALICSFAIFDFVFFHFTSKHDDVLLFIFGVLIGFVVYWAFRLLMYLGSSFVEDVDSQNK